MIIKFTDTAERARFLAQMMSEHPEWESRLRISKSQPTLTLRTPSPEQTTWVRRTLAEKAQTFDDLPFDLFVEPSYAQSMDTANPEDE